MKESGARILFNMRQIRPWPFLGLRLQLWFCIRNMTPVPECAVVWRRWRRLQCWAGALWAISRSVRAMASALSRKAMWMMVCHISTFSS